MSKVIITGSNGLIGSECVRFFHDKDYRIIGIDNDMRSYFFGPEASTEKMKNSLSLLYENYTCLKIDIRDKENIDKVFRENPDTSLIIHTAAQPSHDWAAKEPETDFSINAMGTLNLLESYRKYIPHANFIFTSTNKVYGDRPNHLNMIEQDSRYHCCNPIDESMPIDQCLHSVFGASKVAADIMVQEYGRYFGLNTVCFRGGCLTGPGHQGAELHGFLSYLVKCIVHDKPYTIYGYKGKQVRDNIHSWDLINAFWHYHCNPRAGEVYNIGGGKYNSVSILEAIAKIKSIANVDWNQYTIDPNPRIGDHMWYITDLTKFKTHYPGWYVTIGIDDIIKNMVYNEVSNNE